VETPLTPQEQLLCRWLRTPCGALPDDVITSARHHRVHLLVAVALGPANGSTGWDAALRRELRTCAVRQTARDRVLRETVDRLGANGIDPLLLKGAGLAHIAYPAPHLRPRVDTDLLIRRESLELADAVLMGDGWHRDVESDAELASTQRHYSKTLDGGRAEHLDLHWGLANPPAFAHVLSFDELSARAIPVPPLGPGARTLSIPDALFLACIHLVAHHADDVHLIWLVDIERLVRMLTPEDRRRFRALAARESMSAVCRVALAEAERWLGTSAAASVAAELPADTGAEPSAKWLRRSSRAARLRSDLAALPTWRQRGRLLREHLFPSAAYLRTKYPRCPDRLLPLAALHRIVAGAPAWLRVYSRQVR
jgi:hypothetical protein